MTGVWRWKPGTRQFYSLAGDQDGIQGLAEDDGGLLIALGNRVARLAGGKLETAYVNPPGVRRATRLLRDREGGLWIGTADAGIIHVHQGRADTYSEADGLSANAINAEFEDREGDVWVATHRGLDRFHDYPVVTLSAKQGLPNVSGDAVVAARDGSIWVGTTDGLAKWSRGVARRFTGRGLTAHCSLLEDRDGRIWVAGVDGLGYMENDRFFRVGGVPGGFVYATAKDRDANLWIANLNRGLLQVRDGRVAQQIPWTKFGNRGFAPALAADGSHGGLWLGLSEGGLAYFGDGQVRASYGVADGLGQGAVNGLLFDHEGTLWAATASGLSRLKNGRITTLSSKNGLPCDTVHSVIEHDDGSLWLYMPCGLVRIARSDLDAWASNHIGTIQTTVLDSSDGVRTRGTYDNVGPNVAKSPDGKIW
jgi:ligand-binding sensor domain-containing protein